MNLHKKVSQLLMAVLFSAASSAAMAVPALQLDILGGSYDSGSETTISNGNVFSLYALGETTKVNTTTKYYVSVALLGGTLQTGNLGSFTVNGTTVNVISDMVFGTPPTESAQDHDANDLSTHGVFPTYFKELEFYFSEASKVDSYDVQTGGTANGELYRKTFDFDLTGLVAGTTLHFDLYNEEFKESSERSCTGQGQDRVCTTTSATDVDVDKFAPFSHDAQSGPPTVPLPAAAPLLLSGLGLLGFASRRRKTVK